MQRSLFDRVGPNGLGSQVRRKYRRSGDRPGRSTECNATRKGGADSRQARVGRRLVVIDGHSVAYQAVYGPRRAGLRAPDGTLTGGPYAFLGAFGKLLRVTRPDFLAVARDGDRRRLRRRSWFEGYKAQRGPVDPEVDAQIRLIYELVGLLGVTIVDGGRWEADDVLATLAARGVRKRYEVQLISADKDLHQLIRPGVVCYDPRKSRRVGLDEARERWGVDPEQIPDVQALAGDSSDGIPGVKGVGIAKATELIRAFGSLEDVYANIATLTPALRRNLAKHRPADLLRLVKLRSTLRLDVGLEDLRFEGLDYGNAQPLLDRLGIRTYSK